MPARSEAQRRYLYARFGKAWVERHHFDNPGKLPTRVKPEDRKVRKGGKMLRDASRKR